MGQVERWNMLPFQVAAQMTGGKRSNFAFLDEVLWYVGSSLTKGDYPDSTDERTGEFALMYEEIGDERKFIKWWWRLVPSKEYSRLLKNSWTADEIETGINWDIVVTDIAQQSAKEQEQRLFLGTVFSLAPSGKYYTMWANNNVSLSEALQDRVFFEKLELEASAHNMWVEHGDDPCDIFVVKSQDPTTEETE